MNLERGVWSHRFLSSYKFNNFFFLNLLIYNVFHLNLKKYRNEPYYGPDGHLEASEEEHQDLTKIPGEPGVDYPIYHSVPETSFSCSSVPAVPGMYANVETGCQVYKKL